MSEKQENGDDGRDSDECEDTGGESLPLKESGAEGQCEEEVTRRRVPPDGGWGWMVTLGGFVSVVMIPMLTTSFGILFFPPLLAAGASTSTVAVIFNTFMVMWKVSGALVGSLVKEFGYRKVAMTGNLIVACAMVACAFVTQPEHILVFFSLGAGLGAGLSSARFLIMAQYFDKRRGLANACLSAGIGISQFVNPLLIRFLQEKYSYKGATLIIGAIALHGFVGAMLFHPVMWHMKIEFVTKRKENGTEVSPPEMQPKEVQNSVRIPETKEPKIETPSELRLKRRTHRDSQTSYSSLGEGKGQALVLSSLDISSMASIPNLEVEEQGESKSESRTCAMCHTVIRVLRSVIQDFCILRSPVALIISLSTTFCVNGHANFMVMVPFALQAAGHTLETSAWSISTAGICGFVVRTSVSIMSDFKCFNLKLWFMVSIASLATSIFLFTFLTDLVGLTVVMAMMGCSIGAFQGMNNLLMARTIGLERLTSMFSTTSFIVGIGSIIIGPFAGLMRDVTGSYQICMRVLSGFVFTSFLLWLLMPAAKSYEKRKKSKQENASEP